MSDQVLTVEEARRFLKEQIGLDLPEWRMYELARKGEFPQGEVILRESRTIWWRRSGLEHWIARGGSIRPDSAVA